MDLIISKDFSFDGAVKDIKIFEKYCKIRVQFHFKSSNSLHNIRNLKKKTKENGHSSPDLSAAGAVHHQLSYQAHWEQVVIWVHYKPID